MDETAVWNDIIYNITVELTGSKDVPMETTGHEKVRVSICLAAKLDGTKYKSFVVFVVAKRISKSLNEEFERKCSITSTPNGWMNEELTLRWCDEVLGHFSFQRCLLAWDSYEVHITDAVKIKLIASKLDSVIVPGGCTKYIQAPDVVWNKPFKAKIHELYDQWLANTKHEFTAAGNIMKAVPHQQVVEWVIKAWEEFSRDMIASTIKSCGLGLSIDGSEDHLISCF